MSNENFESILSSVVGNSELMEKISKIVESHKGEDENASLGEVVEEISASLQQKSTENEEKTEKTDTPASKNLKIPTLSKKNHDLLCALKPFMSKGRQDMIDKILTLEQMSEIVKLVR